MKTITLKRFYHTDVTLGEVLIDGKVVCYSLELPDLGNQRNISCIPKGKYKLKIRTTAKRGQHLEVVGVPNRNSILIHSGNSVSDIKGCILLGNTFEFKVHSPKRILNSTISVELFNKIVFEFMLKEEVWLEIV